MSGQKSRGEMLRGYSRDLNQTRPTPYLVLKANAGKLPLKDGSVDLVLATPPFIGARILRKGDYCTSDSSEYRLMIETFLAEAVRILKPHGHILVTSSRPPSQRRKGVRKATFKVLRKEPRRGSWVAITVKREIFWTHYVLVENTCWWAFPLTIYRSLLQRYSLPGNVIAHVFSGSGNGGIAALQMGRCPVLIDLHYHRHVIRRLNREYGLLR